MAVLGDSPADKSHQLLLSNSSQDYSKHTQAGTEQRFRSRLSSRKALYLHIGNGSTQIRHERRANFLCDSFLFMKRPGTDVPGLTVY